VHDSVDQFFRVEQGEGKVVMNGQESEVKEEMVFIVPAGVEHNVINTSDLEELKIYTIYAPPNHPQETVHITREDAMLAEEEHHH